MTWVFINKVIINKNKRESIDQKLRSWGALRISDPLVIMIWISFLFISSYGVFAYGGSESIVYFGVFACAHMPVTGYC